jgi:sialic acid synthase SpsE/spore coat polysaccharide biosynthesis protein SpsF (cytidylyltransferase family)
MMKTGIVLVCHNAPELLLRELQGRSVLGHIVDRIRLGAPGLPVVVAARSASSDDAIAAYCRRAGLECFRGPDDMASRFRACLQAYGFDLGARIDGNNLFLDADALRCMLAIAETGEFDIVANSPGGGFPPGTGIEIERANGNSGHRYLYMNRWGSAADISLALDTEEDLALAQHILALAGPNPAHLGMRQIQAIATRTPVQSPWRGAAGPLLIAEIGGNHEGDFVVARSMAEQAISSGADCVKFQIYRGQSLVSPVESPDRYKHFQRFELLPEQHIELAEMCRRGGVQYLSSVWDMDMLEWIDPYLDFYKIGSGDLTAWPLLREFAKRGKPMLVSTGLATLEEVLQTVEFIQSVDARYTRPEWLCLLQCTSMYPIPDTDAQLLVMDTLRQRTGLAVGYSDHTVGSNAIRAAVAMGADVIEFHFTDSREGKTFRDHQVSLVADEVNQLKSDLKQIAAFRGNGVKVPQKSELETGHDVSFRRAVYVSRAIPKGETITQSDLVLLRPAHGTDARDAASVAGARALLDIEPFKAIRPGVDYSQP